MDVCDTPPINVRKPVIAITVFPITAPNTWALTKSDLPELFVRGAMPPTKNAIAMDKKIITWDEELVCFLLIPQSN